MSDFASSVPDYGRHNQTVDVGETMKVVQAAVDEAIEYERHVCAAEEELKKAKSRLRAVIEDSLPKAMREANIKEFTTESGFVVKLKDKVENHIPAANRNAAWDWLEENGHGDMVKREVTIAFAVGEQELAERVQAQLQRENMRSASCERWAEPSSVKALMTRLIEEGREVPRQLFGVREFAVADIKKKKS